MNHSSYLFYFSYFIIEDANHIILQCEAVSDIRRILFIEIAKLPNGISERIMYVGADLLCE